MTETWKSLDGASTMKRRIILADHRTLLRSGLRCLLEHIPGLEIVGEASHGVGLPERVLRLQPDGLVLAPDLKGLNGREIARRVHRGSPSTRILMISEEAEPARVVRALAAGAQGYLLTGEKPEELANALTRLFRGRAFTSVCFDVFGEVTLS